jgi:hypothetical protein
MEPDTKSLVNALGKPTEPTADSASDEAIIERELEKADGLIQELIPDLDLSGSDPSQNNPPLSTPDACAKCGSPTTQVCPTCHGPFCIDHASLLDTTYCNLCLPVTTVSSEDGIKTPDGVTHNGRVIHTEGPFFGAGEKSGIRHIVDMTEYQLEAHIGHYRDLIRQSERQLDYSRTMLGAAQIELNHRQDQIRRHFPKTHGKTINVRLPGAPETPSQKRERKSPSKALASQLNVTPEQSAALMQALMQMIKNAPGEKK